MSRRYRRTAVLLITCLCVSLFSETLYAQGAQDTQAQSAEEPKGQGDALQPEAKEALQGQGYAPQPEEEEEPQGQGDAMQPEEGSSGDAAGLAGDIPVEAQSAEDDDPGRGRLSGDAPAEFYDKDTGIQEMATGIKHNSKFTGYDILDGIDVSKWNKTINWTSVKKAGIDFAFVRTSYRGYEKGGLATDNYAASNLKNAAAAGVKVGAYIFSQAITVKEAQEEADYLLESVKGYEITMPLVFDYEYYSGGRLDKGKLSKRAQTNICLAFCEKIKEAGYTPLVYANKSMLTSGLYASEISSKYPIWLANYTTSTSYTGDYTFWQYREDGSVSGISGNVDMNVWYVKPGSSTDFNTPGGSTTDPENPDNPDNPDNPGDNTAPGEPEKPTTPSIQAPATPTLTATAESTDKVKLSWKKIADATGYILYRYNSVDKKYERIKTISKVGTVSYTDTGRSAGTVYQYRMRAYKKSGSAKAYSKYSGTVSVTTDSPITGNVTGKVNGTDVAVRKSPSTSAAKLTTVTVNTGVTITGTNGSWYKVSIKIDGKDQTGYISKTYVTIIDKPALSASAASASKIKLKWKQVPEAEGYVIQRYNAAKKKYEKIKTIKKGTTVSYTNSGLTKKTTYKYRMRAYKTVRGRKIYSDYSPAKSAKTK